MSVQFFYTFLTKNSDYNLFVIKNFEFKNYLNHYLKRSDHFLGTLKFLHTVSVSSSDSLVIGFLCMDENSRPRKQARLDTFLIPGRDEKS
jgi:hypothetical protein